MTARVDGLWVVWFVIVRLLALFLAVLVVVLAGAGCAKTAVSVIAVVINEGDQGLGVGDSVQLTVTVEAVGRARPAVVWRSDDEAVVTVDRDGMVVGVAAGETTVTATSRVAPHVRGSVLVTVVAMFERAPSYVDISNVSLLPALGDTREVRFDVRWDESWRGPDRPTWVEASDNWDAVWIFVKYRVDGGAWQHATLAMSGHEAPPGAVVIVPSDQVGAFIYRSAPGYGTFTADGVRLAWDHVADGVSTGANVEVRPFGIEMVYVPEGDFSLGSGGNGGSREFRAGGTSSTPFVVDSQASVRLGDSAGHLMWTAGEYSGSPSGRTSASFPTGYGAFYVMKYQVRQGQYVDFLNALTQAQADARKHTADQHRYAITGDRVGSYETSLPFVALNSVSWADGAAFAAWAGLRPLTELEFEKAARGPIAPVPGEFAWGSRSITQATGIAYAGTIMETPTPAGANAVYTCWSWEDGSIGPVRVGSFAAPGRSRRDAGAGYYGALELSGNLYERAVTVGNPEGRAFEGTHGDGTLDADGNANVASWPGADAVGTGFRGGSWSYDDGLLRVSDRQEAADSQAIRHNDFGWRGARSAP